jgi:hypothetical protein
MYLMILIVTNTITLRQIKDQIISAGSYICTSIFKVLRLFKVTLNKKPHRIGSTKVSFFYYQ